MSKLLWVFAVVGIIAIFWGLNKKAVVKVVDEKGRLFSIMNIIDFAALTFIVWLIPGIIAGNMIFSGSNSPVEKSLTKEVILREAQAKHNEEIAKVKKEYENKLAQGIEKLKAEVEQEKARLNATWSGYVKGLERGGRHEPLF